MLSVPVEALEQLVKTFEPRNAENGIIAIDAETLNRQFIYSATWANDMYNGETLSVEGTIPQSGLRPLCGFAPAHFALAGLAAQALLRNRKTSVT